jgi:ABC-type multidrug transport system fused ATPase/permease subunit
MDAMERLKHGRTTFIITHRLTTLSRCDRLFQVEDGRLVRIASGEPLIVGRGLAFEARGELNPRRKADKGLR